MSLHPRTKFIGTDGDGYHPVTTLSKPIHILVIEDDAINAELVHRMFDFHNGGQTLSIVGTLTEARDCLKNFIPDLVIAEWRLPDGTCLELVPSQRPEDSYPLIVMTSHGDEQIAVEAMKSGALDYVVKTDESLENLPHLAERAVREWEALKQQQETEKLQDLQKDILEKIVLGEPVIDILNSLCLHIQEMIPETICSVMLLEDTTQSLRVLSAPSAPEELKTALDGLKPGEQAASCGTAAYTGEPVFVVDTEIDPRWSKYRDLALEFGIRGCWSIPIACKKNTTLGTFGISHRTAKVPTPFYQKLLETASYMAGITIQKRVAEDKLPASEDRYRDLYESAPCAYFTSRLDGQIMSVNTTAVQLFGYTKTNLVGRSIFDIFAPTSSGRGRAIDLLKQTKDVNEINGEQLELQKANGTLLWVSLTLRVIRDVNQDPIGWRAIVIDITERKQGEEALLLTKRVFESSSDHLSVVGPDYRYQQVNPMYERVHQTSATDIIGRPIRDMLGEETFTQIIKPQFDRCLQGEEISYESWFHFKDGVDRFMLVTYSPLQAREHADSTQAVVVTCRDLTHRKRSEEALQEKEQRLRHLLEERTRISQDLHDHILQSLYAIGLIIAAAKYPIHLGSSQEAVRHLDHAINQLNAAINEIRCYIEGRSPASLHWRSFSGELNSLVRSMKLMGITNFKVKIDEEAAITLSQEQTHDLLNIARESMSNSVRHSQATAGCLRLRFTSQGIRFAIIDNGVGLPEGCDIASGHGLHNMRARAEHLHGRFHIRSRRGKGTCVIVDLPRE